MAGTAMHHALVRPPADTYASGLTQSREGPPDLKLALAQHGAYCQALRDAGTQVTVMPPDPQYPDSCFVEDPAIITPRGAIAMRPGAPSRQGEVASVVAALKRWYPDIPQITAPGTVDGGDVCEADGHYFIGMSSRTNPAGADQLAALLADLGYRASILDLRANRRLLHLKTGMAYVGEGRIVATADVPQSDDLAAYERIPVAEDERYAANCIRVRDRVLIAAGNPKLAEALADCGYDLRCVTMSEFRKMDGGLSCLSLRGIVA